ncbi:hypothetical protein OG301_38335 [Streptomyces platensis]|uniref:hypothetical protein n=1 Tax=Streptomyces platensis TaxID=58346 RepID=UPI002ED0CE2F|nr:hypothetical protein OG301_38335 [Streptomyces platensis]
MSPSPIRATRSPASGPAPPSRLPSPAREPLTLNDLQQWLGHKHPAGTRYYAAILQHTLTASYKKADYFARDFRTIQVLIDRESILTGATHQAANSPGSTTTWASALLQ